MDSEASEKSLDTITDNNYPILMTQVTLEITSQGGIRMLHDDAVDLAQFGEIHIERASHVEYAERAASEAMDDGVEPGWYVQSARTGKMLATGFKTRAEALSWEKDYYSPGGKGWKELTEPEEAS